jgi:hypothetical protein
MNNGTALLPAKKLSNVLPSEGFKFLRVDVDFTRDSAPILDGPVTFPYYIVPDGSQYQRIVVSLGQITGGASPLSKVNALTFSWRPSFTTDGDAQQLTGGNTLIVYNNQTGQVLYVSGNNAVQNQSLVSGSRPFTMVDSFGDVEFFLLNTSGVQQGKGSFLFSNFDIFPYYDVCSDNITSTTQASGGLFAPLMTPPIPTQANSGFTFAVNQQGTFVANDVATGIQLQESATTATLIEGVAASYPATPFTFDVLLSALVTPSSSSSAGTDIGIAIGPMFAPDSSAQILLYFGHNNSWSWFIQNWFDPNTVEEQVTEQQSGSLPFVWMRYTDDGTTIAYLASSDGINYATIYTVAKSSGFLPADGYNNLGIFTFSPEDAQGTTVQVCKVTSGISASVRKLTLVKKPSLISRMMTVVKGLKNGTGKHT